LKKLVRVSLYTSTQSASGVFLLRASRRAGAA